MDNIDTAILDCLKENGRVTASEISKKVKLSIPAVAERIRKLEQNSIIQKYTIKLDRRLPDVLECHHLAGAYDYLLKVSVRDTDALESFLTNKLKKITGVSSSNTFITLATLKEELNC